MESTLPCQVYGLVDEPFFFSFEESRTLTSDESGGTQQPGRVGAVTEKDFAFSEKKRQICKNITTLCFHAEK